MDNPLRDIMEQVNTAIERKDILNAIAILQHHKMAIPEELVVQAKRYLEEEQFPGQDVIVKAKGHILSITVFRRGVDRRTRHAVEDDIDAEL